MKRTITRAPYTGAPFGTLAAAAKPPATPPTFTAQPQAQALYQEGGKLEILGAATDNATAYQWQKQNSDQSWGDITGRTGASITVSSADTSWQGKLRLKAVNNDSAPAYSNVVDVVNVYLLIDNDVGATNDPAKVSDTQYNWTTTAAGGAKYVSAFYCRADDDTRFTPNGLSTARAVATWATDNQTVAPVNASNVTAAGQWKPTLTAGTANATASIGNLQSKVSITVS